MAPANFLKPLLIFFLHAAPQNSGFPMKMTAYFGISRHATLSCGNCTRSALCVRCIAGRWNACVAYLGQVCWWLWSAQSFGSKLWESDGLKETKGTKSSINVISVQKTRVLPQRRLWQRDQMRRVWATMSNHCKSQQLARSVTPRSPFDHPRPASHNNCIATMWLCGDGLKLGGITIKLIKQMWKKLRMKDKLQTYRTISNSQSLFQTPIFLSFFHTHCGCVCSSFTQVLERVVFSWALGECLPKDTLNRHCRDQFRWFGSTWTLQDFATADIVWETAKVCRCFDTLNSWD